MSARRGAGSPLPLRPSGPEKRRWARREYSGGRLPPAARLKPGPQVVLVNLSRSGALVEGQARPRAGSTCELEYTGPLGLVRTPARVARCFVARVEPAAVRYRTALAFDSLVPAPADPDLLAGYQVPARGIDGGSGGVVAARGRRLDERPGQPAPSSHR